jgi:phospholipid transport system substrate-binding protein
MRRFCLIVASTTFAFLITVPAQAKTSEDPGTVVKTTVNKVLDTLRDSQMPLEQKRDKVYALVEARTDFVDMSRRILALNWTKATPAQRARFEELFKRVLMGTYWNKIKHYTNEKVEFLTGMVRGHTYATVSSFVITTDKVKIPIAYRMHFVRGKWLCYDFVVEKLSLDSTYRSDYRNRIKDGGMDGLLKSMEGDIKKIESGSN